ncbi:aspartate--tRNA ligase [bacterium]|nr:aspartate--tRNA ligase [bacterium]
MTKNLSFKESFIQDKLRTHSCNQLRKSDIGKQVVLMGWVHHRRDHGGVIFIDLRDRDGLTQVVFNPAVNKQCHEKAEDFRNEYVIYIEGVVQPRPADALNTNLPTGEIEVMVHTVKLLNSCRPLPFQLDQTTPVSEELRLTYRYLDLRTPYMANIMKTRSKVTFAVREYLDKQGFLEIETPILTKSTPEGARDYLVPSRINPGNFYALPQSPQIMKQLLMVAGIDKYFQICRCFRDEDLRADRQPEFTQIDMEMSFSTQEEVFRITEGVISSMFKSGLNIDIKLPFTRMTYKEAMDIYGSDKPDLRFGLKLFQATDIMNNSNFKIFNGTIANGGVIKGLCYPNGAKFSRKELDDLTSFAGIHGAKGLAWFKISEDKFQSPIAKFFSDDQLNKLKNMGRANTGDIIFLICDKETVVNQALAALRNQLALIGNLIPENQFNLLWITEFPLFKYNENEKRLESEHHPFTAPFTEDIDKLDTDPLNIRSSSYDLVMNGCEIASGSLRIHNFELQQKIFELLNLDKKTIQQQFGFFIEALKYGAPPHAGIAPGLDRIIMLMLGLPNIRDVIAFPKTQKASCLMSKSPSPVSEAQLKELEIRIPKKKPKDA